MFCVSLSSEYNWDPGRNKIPIKTKINLFL